MSNICLRFNLSGALFVLGCAVSLGAAADEPTYPLGLNAEAAAWLSEALLADAAPGYLPEDIAAGLAGSDVATSLAVAVDPTNRRAWTLRGELLATTGDFDGAAECCRRALELADWADMEAGANWLRYRLAGLSTAEQRQAVLSAVADDAARPAALRAEALVNLAAVLEGRGLFDRARDAYEKALALEPGQPTAARAVVRLAETPDIVDRARSSARLLKANPKAVNVAWELGMICRDVGLYVRAAALYDYAAEVTRVSGGHPGQSFRRDRLEALLDAGLYARVIEMDPSSDAGLLDLPMAGCLVEAYRALGDEKSAAALVEKMRDTYAPSETLARSRAALAAELAWFNYYYRRSRALAVNWADMAIKASSSNPQARRVWAIVHLRDAEHREKVESYLTALAADDLYALAALIEFKGLGDDETAGLIERLGAFPRRGPDWRYARAALAPLGIRMPGHHRSADAIDALAADLLDSPADEMGRAPERFLAFEMVPAAARVAPGHRPAVTLSLKNISSADVPVGEWGLISPVVNLSVTMTVDAERLTVSQDVPVRLACGRMLNAGATLTRTVRLDVGRIAEALKRRPLSEARFTVEAVLDPVMAAAGQRSAVATIAVSPCELTRSSLLDQQSPEAYAAALLGLVKDLRGDDVVAAMRAASVTVSLLRLSDEVAAGRTLPAGKLGPGLRRPELYSMLRYCLRQAPAAVRMATLNELAGRAEDELAISLAAPNLSGGQALVRAAAVRLIGPTGYGRKLALLERFGKSDPDALVRHTARRLADAGD